MRNRAERRAWPLERVSIRPLGNGSSGTEFVCCRGQIAHGDIPGLERDDERRSGARRAVVLVLRRDLGEALLGVRPDVIVVPVLLDLCEVCLLVGREVGV